MPETLADQRLSRDSLDPCRGTESSYCPRPGTAEVLGHPLVEVAVVAAAVPLVAEGYCTAARRTTLRPTGTPGPAPQS